MKQESQSSSVHLSNDDLLLLCGFKLQCNMWGWVGEGGGGGLLKINNVWHYFGAEYALHQLLKYIIFTVFVFLDL